jgi:hypothetical protein
LLNCDTLICDSKYYKNLWKHKKDEIFSDFIKYKKNISTVIFYDIGDSTGFLIAEILPYVDRYIKSFTYKDKEQYLVPFYAGRIWTDYYNKEFNVIDKDEVNQFLIQNKSDLSKIYTGYNGSLANFSRRSNLSIGNWRNEIQRLLFKSSLGYPNNNEFVSPSLNRKNLISCRMSTNYSRESISFQRKVIKEMLLKYISVSKLNRSKYFNELCSSKVVISPFGWGELNTPRDYEVAMCGSLILKPELNHIDTWPNYFTDDKVAVFKWDFSNLLDTIEDINSNYRNYLEKAINYQNMYKYFLTTEDGYHDFCKYFKRLVV